MISASDSHVDPLLHFFRHPCDPTGSELYPLGELAGGFETRDVRGAVGDAVSRPELLLGHELPFHCTSLVKGTLQRPVSPGAQRG